MKPSAIAVTDDALDTWFGDLTLFRPPAMTACDRTRARDCRSAALQPDATGVLLRLATDEGLHIDLRLNPAITQVLREALLICATDAGWMNDDGRLLPEPPAENPALHLRCVA